MEHNRFHIYTITESVWNHLCRLYAKKDYYFSCFKNYIVKSNDHIIFYQKSDNPAKRGFVGMCQTESDLQLNVKKIKIFNDINLNTFYCTVKNVTLFYTVIKISNINNDLKKQTTSYKSLQSFSCKYLKKIEEFTTLPLDIGKKIINILIDANKLDLSVKDVSDNSSNSSDSSSNESDDESVDESVDESDEYLIKGHIPILFEPCKKFIWDGDIIKNFKYHYIECEKCIKTDNNDIQIIKQLNKSIYLIKKIKDIDEIEKYCNNYYNLTKCYYEVSDKLKDKNCINLLKIINYEHVYNKCILILW